MESKAPQDPSVNPLIQKNVHALLKVRREEEERMGRFDRMADAITRFTGSLPFLLIHVALVVGWFVLNTGYLLRLKPWDPYPFVMLAMAASVEAIFLSTFVLISQNRQAALADRRAELDLQIGLLTEHEVTRTIHMLHKLLEHHGIQAEWSDLEDLKKEVAPDRVLVQIEQQLDDQAP
jgi:uncharacterized membrane protein